MFFTLNREDFSFVIHLDRQPRTSRRREAQTGSRARSGSRSERTLDAVEHSRTLMEWWPFLIFHRGGLRIKVINNTVYLKRTEPLCSDFASDRIPRKDLRMSTSLRKRMKQNKSKSHLNSAYGSKCVLSCVPGDQEKYLRQRSSLPIYGHSSGRHTPLRSSGNFLIRHFAC